MYLKRKRKKNTVEKKKKECDQLLEDVIINGGDADVIDITVTFRGNELQKLVKGDDEDLEKYLKLSANMSTRNLYLYNNKGVITKYDTPLDIINEFYECRLKMYTKRKMYYLRILLNELEILKYKVKYIRDILEGTIIIQKQKKDDVMKKNRKIRFSKTITEIRCI